jgi:predicted RNase H-like nuclease (RuvC/YqgF family)
MSSGRIEIPMDEYRGMKDRIEELEKTLVSKDKEIESLKDKCLTVETQLEDIASLSLSERIFNWGSNIKKIIGDNE